MQSLPIWPVPAERFRNPLCPLRVQVLPPEHPQRMRMLGHMHDVLPPQLITHGAAVHGQAGNAPGAGGDLHLNGALGIQWDDDRPEGKGPRTDGRYDGRWQLRMHNGAAGG